MIEKPSMMNESLLEGSWLDSSWNFNHYQTHYFYEGKNIEEKVCSKLRKSTTFLQVFFLFLFRGTLERWLKRRIFFLRELCHFQTQEKSSSVLVQLLSSCCSWKNKDLLATKSSDSVLLSDNVIMFGTFTPKPSSDFC